MTAVTTLNGKILSAMEIWNNAGHLREFIADRYGSNISADSWPSVSEQVACMGCVARLESLTS